MINDWVPKVVHPLVGLKTESLTTESGLERCESLAFCWKRELRRKFQWKNWMWTLRPALVHIFKESYYNTLMDTFNFHAGNNFANREHKRFPWQPCLLLQGKQWLQTVAVNLQSCCLWNGYFEVWDPVCNHSQPTAVFTATLMHQDCNKMAKTATRWSQSLIEWGQVDN